MEIYNPPGVVTSAAIAAALSGTPVDFPVKGGSFIQQVTASGWPAATVSEPLFKNTLSGGNTLALWNAASDGYSALTARTYLNYEVLAFGYGNPTSAGFFAGRNYIETHTGHIPGQLLPVPFMFARDGLYGRTGTPGIDQGIQQFTIDHLGMHFWKGVPWVTGPEQVEVAQISDGGFFGVLNSVEPNAIDMPKGICAVWFDKTGGATALNFKVRDAAGVITKGTLATTTAFAATASDTFTAADNATVINGRTPDVGAAWAVITNNWGIISNKAYRSGGSADDYAYINTTKSDIEVTCDITLSTVRATANLILRGVDANNYTSVQLGKNPGGNTNTIQVLKKVSGSFQQVATTPYTLTLGSTYNVRAGAVGNSIFVYINDVFVLRCEDATHISATRQGIASYNGPSDDDGGSRWDNFRVYV